jgi:hypothetical protein
VLYLLITTLIMAMPLIVAMTLTVAMALIHTLLFAKLI